MGRHGLGNGRLKWQISIGKHVQNWARQKLHPNPFIFWSISWVHIFLTKRSKNWLISYTLGTQIILAKWILENNNTEYYLDFRCTQIWWFCRKNVEKFFCLKFFLSEVFFHLKFFCLTFFLLEVVWSFLSEVFFECNELWESTESAHIPLVQIRSVNNIYGMFLLV